MAIFFTQNESNAIDWHGARSLAGRSLFQREL